MASMANGNSNVNMREASMSDDDNCVKIDILQGNEGEDEDDDHDDEGQA